MLERPLIGVFGVAKFSKRPCALVIRSRRVLCCVRLTSLFRFPNHCSPFQAGCCSLWNDRSSLSSGLLPLRKCCGLFRTVSNFIQSALVCLGGSCYFGTQLLKNNILEFVQRFSSVFPSSRTACCCLASQMLQTFSAVCCFTRSLQLLLRFFSRWPR